MLRDSELNRRTFLRNAGTTALLGAVGAKTAFASEAIRTPSVLLNEKYDFDELPTNNRLRKSRTNISGKT